MPRTTAARAGTGSRSAECSGLRPAPGMSTSSQLAGSNSFARIRTPPLVNSAQLAPASDSTAVLARGVGARLLRTTDGGKTWNAPKTPGRATDVIWVGFTDARVGAALAHGYDASAKTEVTALWRTTDGGATWSKVRVG